MSVRDIAFERETFSPGPHSGMDHCHRLLGDKEIFDRLVESDGAAETIYAQLLRSIYNALLMIVPHSPGASKNTHVDQANAPHGSRPHLSQPNRLHSRSTNDAALARKRSVYAKKAVLR